MTDAEAIRFYVEAISASARQWPVSEARAFLRGALLVGGEHDSIDPLRQAYMHLHDADAQLELIASGQLKLNLEAQG